MIYFIYDDLSNAVKIGKTQDNNVYMRLSSIQTGNPRELKLLGVIAGYTKEEQELHNRFEVYRIRGEWFKYVNEVKLFILENVKEYNSVNKYKYNSDSCSKYYEKYKSSIYESLNKYFIKDSNSIITIKDVKEYLLSNKIPNMNNKGTLSVTKVANYFNCEVKNMRIGKNKKPTRCIVGLALLF